jgi:hypothetical protein
MINLGIKIEGLFLYIDKSMEDDSIRYGRKTNIQNGIKSYVRSHIFCNEKTADILISKEKIKQREEKLNRILYD